MGDDFMWKLLDTEIRYACENSSHTCRSQELGSFARTSLPCESGVVNIDIKVNFSSTV
jgi:hypothetical protein